MLSNDKVIKFSSDTKHRKEWFTGLSFSHPAKMSLPLQLWLIDQFSKPGETILDPMAGSGTLLVACSMGRNVLCVELETKFVDMMKGNWEKIQQRGPQMGYEMGQATILQGDARNLTGLLADKIITSPTYGNPRNTSEEYDDKYDLRRPKGVAWGRESFRGRYGKTEGQVGNLPYGQVDSVISSPPFQEGDIQRPGKAQSVKNYDYGSKLKHQGQGPENIANLAERHYGDISAIISSPPYEEAMGEKHHSPRADKLAEEKSNPVTYTEKVDAVISSPPYETSVTGQSGIDPTKMTRGQADNWKPRDRSKEPAWDNSIFHPGGFSYSQTKDNIGNLKSTSYLGAMLTVYQQCFEILKPGGLMILVTKNFIRNKAIVRLDEDTIKLCEQAGFTFRDRWYRELTSQSFWRTIYKRRYPDAPTIDFEDCLIFSS